MSKETTFKQLCDGKMWRAVEAMIVGLETQSQRLDFEIDMGTYGESYSNQNFCVGCAATSTIQQLARINLTGNNISTEEDRAEALGVNKRDLSTFEAHINQLRLGNLSTLCNYFNIPVVNYPGLNNVLINWENDWYDFPILTNTDWRENLHRYRVLLRYLKWLNI